MYDRRRQHQPANPNGLCMCGCGERTPIATYTFGRRGIYKGLPLRYIRGHQQFARRGQKSHAWKGGTYTTHMGYIAQYAPEHPNNNGGYVLQHRLVMESVLGRLLTKDECIHHVNGNKTDNRPENLQVVTPSEHGRHHFDDTITKWVKSNPKHASQIRSAAGRKGAARRWHGA